MINKGFFLSTIAEQKLENTLASDFNGIDERIIFGTDPSLRFPFNTDFSFDFWLYPRSNATYRILSTQTVTSPFQGYSFFATGGRFGLSLINNFPANYLEVRTNVIFPLNMWYHIAVSFEGTAGFGASNVEIRVNNLLQVLFPQNDNLSANAAYAAQFQISGFDGANQLGDFIIDEVHPWAYKLSSSDVFKLYGNGSPVDPTALGPVSWWRMGDTDNATTIVDQIGSNNGTLVNMNASNYVTNVP